MNANDRAKSARFHELLNAIDALNALLKVTKKNGDRSGEAVSEDLGFAHRAIDFGADRDNAASLLRKVSKSKWLRDVRSSTLSKRQATKLAAVESALAKALAPSSEEQ